MEELCDYVVTLCELREKVGERMTGFGTPAPPRGRVGQDLPDQSDAHNLPQRLKNAQWGGTVVLNTKQLLVKVILQSLPPPWCSLGLL